MKLSISPELASRLIAHLRAHVKTKYRYQKCAAHRYGVSYDRMKKILAGVYSPSAAMLEDAGVTITWEAK